jgi:hypothetical protein
MAETDIVAILRPVVEKIELLGDYLTQEEVTRALQLARELRAIYDTGVERITSGRVS